MRTGEARYLRMIEAGLVTDVVDEDGKSLRGSSAQGALVQHDSVSGIFGARRSGVKVAGSTVAEEAQSPDSFAATEKACGGRVAYDRAKAAGKTKLTYGQWVQVRTPKFKAWFGDWEAARAQDRLDAMEPLKVRVPDAWRSMDHVALRQKMARELDRMVREKTEIAHPDIGVIRVGRAGAKKSEGSARDPAKSLVAADIEALIPASIYARSDASRGGDGPDIAGYSTLLARVQVDGVDLVASFTVRHQSDGQWYYNAVALHDTKEKAQDSYGRPDQQAGSSFAPIAGLSDFVRRPLARVNTDASSKVVDSQTGEPLVVYHGTNADFEAFRSGTAYFTPRTDYGYVRDSMVNIPNIDTFLHHGEFPMAKPFEVTWPAIAAANAGLNPAGVAVDASAGDAASQFTAPRAGNYFYAVAAIGSAGQGYSQVVKSGQAAVAAGKKAVLTITASASGSESGYAIYRSRQNGTNDTGDFHLVKVIAKTGATTTFTDLNRDIPGTVSVPCLNMNPISDAIGWRQFQPMTKIPLPFGVGGVPVMSWFQFLFGYLRMTKPKHHGYIKNILPGNVISNQKRQNAMKSVCRGFDPRTSHQIGLMAKTLLSLWQQGFFNSALL